MTVSEAIESRLKKMPSYLMMTIEVRKAMVETMAKIVMKDVKDPLLRVEK